MTETITIIIVVLIGGFLFWNLYIKNTILAESLGQLFRLISRRKKSEKKSEPNLVDERVRQNEFDAYQIAARQTAMYPNKNDELGLIYVALGLAGESGEAADKIKKWWRNGRLGQLTEQEKTDYALELGDVLWYVANNAQEIGWTLKEIADLNIEKLTDRKERGVIASEGDHR